MKKSRAPALSASSFSDHDVYLQPEVAKQWERLVRATGLEKDIRLVDGYRTEKEQRRLWEYSLKRKRVSLYQTIRCFARLQ